MNLMRSYTTFDYSSQVTPAAGVNTTAFIELKMIKTKKGYSWQTALYVRQANAAPKLLTVANGINSLIWSADNKNIYYLASGEKHQSIWQVNITTRQAKKLFEFKSDITAFQWAPNSKALAFVASDSATPQTQLINVAMNDNDRVYHIDTTQKTWQAKALTPANVSITQTSNLDHGFSWSPDSQNIAFAYQPQASATYWTQAKIAIVNLQTQQIRQLPTNEHFVVNQPMYSPDGKWLAFRANSADLTALKNNSVVYEQICIADSKNLKTTCLQNTFNEDPVILGWNMKSNLIYVIDWYQVMGPQIYGISVNPQTPVTTISKLDGYLDMASLSLARNHQIVGLRYETPNGMPQAYSSNLEEFKLQQVSHLPTIKRTLGNTKTIHWNSADGTSVEGLLIVPPDYDAKKAYPLLVDIHGGPAGGSWAKRYLGGCQEYGQSFVPDCYANLLSQGFIIFQANYRGSTGYGLKFRIANYQDLGGGDYQDIMAGVAWLIKQGIADPNHMAVYGWSYGGYMTNWIITQTQQFKAAITGDGLSDLIAMTNTTDIPWYLPQYLGSYYWDNPKLYLARAPIMYVKNVMTPLLILHGGNDTRVPLTQGQELYQALLIQHKPVKMLIAPGQGHVPDNAQVIRDEIMAINGWLKRV